MNKMTDQEILDQIVKRDPKAIMYLRNEYFPIVRFLADKLGIKTDQGVLYVYDYEIEDIFNDAMYVLVEKVFSGNFTLTAKLSTYFYAVCKNMITTRLKRKLLDFRFRENAQWTPEDSDVVETSYVDEMKQNIFDHYYESLSKVCKEILNFYFLNYSVAEIAEKTGNSKNYIMKRKYECQNRLMLLIKGDPDNITLKKNEHVDI
jgi:RNA polymerase sigma factor (sigma-70 family)